MIFEEYVTVSGKKLRKGYTTGSCAAAAAKAAVQMLVSGNPVTLISIDTPAGVRLTLPVTDAVIGAMEAGCSVIKDGGDDPDVTNGMKICAAARYRDEAGIEIAAGEGIGTVTLPGLKVPPGSPAINPAPLQMIRKEVAEVLPPDRGVKVIISAPDGEEAARRTFNAKLGIVGGISILGTKGIEEPMSEEALKESLALELGIMARQGLKKAALVFGNYGEEFALKSLKIRPQYIMKMGNYIGFMLEKADESQFSDLLIVGHIGKMVKVAAGIFQTHSRVADARGEILCAYAGLEGADPATLTAIYQCRTTEAAVKVILDNGLTGVFSRIGENVARRCSEYVYGRVRIGSVLYAGSDTPLYLNRESREMSEELQQ